MPYPLIALLVVLAVTGRFVITSDVSIRAKALIVFACVATIALPHALPRWQLASILAQVFLVIALLLHSKVHT